MRRSPLRRRARSRLARRSAGAACLLAVLLTATCGDGEDSADNRAATPTERIDGHSRPDAEPHLWDDTDLVDAVFAAAHEGGAPPWPGGELPPRISPMRVAVDALHDLLLERRAPPVADDAFFDALGTVRELRGGSESGADVSGALAAWRAWSAEERSNAAEHERLAALAAAAVSGTQPPGTDGLRTLRERWDTLPPPPPRSMAAGWRTVLPVVELVLAGGDDVPTELTDALDAARRWYSENGWPGGLARALEPVAEFSFAKAPNGMRTSFVWDAVFASFRAAGDDLGIARMHLRRATAAAATRRLRQAERLAAAGREFVTRSGASGPEPFDAAALHAGLLQALGRQNETLDAITVALSEADAAGAAALPRAELTRTAAVSLARLGRPKEAFDTASDALAALPADAPDARRAEFLEVIGGTAHGVGEFEHAVDAYRRAAALHDKTTGPRGSADAAARRDQDLLYAARALAGAGRGPEALAAVRDVFHDNRAPSLGTYALGATTALESGGSELAEQLVRKGERAGGDHAAALGDVAGRVYAARGDLGKARERFRAGLQFVTKGRPPPQGRLAAALLEHWADAELAAGNADDGLRVLREALGHVIDGSAPDVQARLTERIARLSE